MILVVAPLLGIGYVVQGVAKNPGLLNTGRFISGIAGGLACGPGAVNYKIFDTCQKGYNFYSMYFRVYNLNIYISIYHFRRMSLKFRK